MAAQYTVPLLTALLLTGCSDTLTSGSQWELHDETPNPPGGSAQGGTDNQETPPVIQCTENDLEIDVVPMVGNVDIGAADPTGWSVAFIDNATAARYHFGVELGRGGAQYDATLVAGRYDVHLFADGLPGCAYFCGTVVASGLDVNRGSAPPDLKLELATVDGTVTVDGESLSEPISLSRVLFEDPRAGGRFEFDVAPDGRFDATVPKGIYNVSWTTFRRGATAEELRRRPQGVASLGEVTVAGDGPLVLDARTTEVTVELRTEQNLAAVVDWSPTLTFRSEASFDESRVELTARETTFRMFPGDYQIHLTTARAGIALCDWDGCTVSSDESGRWVLQVDDWLTREAVSTSGRVELAGEFGDDCRAGELRFRVDDDTALQMPSRIRPPYAPTWSVPLTAGGEFALDLPPARYQVSLHRARWHCDRPDIALGTAILDDDFLVGGPVPAQFREPRGQLLAELRVNGQPLRDNPGESRGMFELTNELGTQIEISLGDVGPAALDRRILPGSYDAQVTTEIVSRTITYYDQEVLPRGSRALGRVQILADSPTRLDFDVDVTPWSDAVSFLGLRSLDATSNPGLAVRLIDLASDSVFDFPLGPDGGVSGLAYPGTYRATLVQTPWPTTSGAPFGNTLLSSCYRVTANRASAQPVF